MDILVVEDDVLVRTTLVDMLQLLGHRVDDVGTAKAALGRLESHHHDIVLTDVTLPGMSGLDLVSAIDERWPDIKIIVASGWGLGDMAALKKRVSFLSKPFDLDRLRIAIEHTARN